MKILFVTDGIHPLVVGGMQKHSTMLSKYLARSGIQITLVHTGNQSGTDLNIDSIYSKEELSNINLIEIPFIDNSKVPGHYIRANKDFSSRAYEAVKHQIAEFDIIYCKGFSAWAFIHAKKKGELNAPICTKLHGYEMYVHIPGFIRKIQQYYLRKIAGFVSKEADFCFSYGGRINALIESIGVSPDRIIVCPGGIESDWVRDEIRPTSEEKQFLFIGRYERRKGIQEIHEAINNLEKEKFKFHFIGPIPEENRLENTNCIYHGLIKDPHKVRQILDDSDVLVCPSYAEGMPNVIFEGMSRGLAIIGTDVGAVSDQIQRNGWIVNIGDSVSIANTMKEVIEMAGPELDKRKQESLNLIREKFVWEKVTQHFIKCLEAIKET
jgi:glycosyltransferase involved in cell wall biosynthesis